MIFCLLVAGLPGVAEPAIAQGEKEHRKNMIADSEKANGEAKVIVSGSHFYINRQRKQVKELPVTLQKAKAYCFKSKVPHQRKHAIEHNSIDTHFASVSEIEKALNNEPNKPKPNEKKVKEYANVLFEAIEKKRKIRSFIFECVPVSRVTPFNRKPIHLEAISKIHHHVRLILSKPSFSTE